MVYSVHSRKIKIVKNNLNPIEVNEGEDVAFFALDTNEAYTIPVYRFYEESRGIHFYTGNETERAFIQENLDNYSFEGIAYYALSTENENISA